MAPLPNEKGSPTELPCNCLVSSVLRRLPFPFPFTRSVPPQPPSVHQLNLGHIHATLVSAAEQCFQALGAVASENTLFKSLLALPSSFQNFCQIHCWKSPSPTSLSAHNFAAILPGDSVTGLVVANGITNFLNLYNTLLVVRLVLTWFPNSPPAIVSPLSTLCDPYLNIFRGIIPPLGGTLDLSPILAFLVLNAFTSSAAALPAELPVAGTTLQDSSSSDFKPLNLTSMQERWMKRLCCQSSENSKDPHES